MLVSSLNYDSSLILRELIQFYILNILRIRIQIIRSTRPPRFIRIDYFLLSPFRSFGRKCHNPLWWSTELGLFALLFITVEEPLSVLIVCSALFGAIHFSLGALNRRSPTTIHKNVPLSGT